MEVRKDTKLGCVVVNLTGMLVLWKSGNAEGLPQDQSPASPKSAQLA